MARVHVYKVLINTDGSVLTGASVQVNQEAGGPLSQTLYANETGSTTLTNPFVSASGLVEFWLNAPDRCSIVFTPSGGSPTTVIVDAVPAGNESVRDLGDGTLGFNITNVPTAGMLLTATDTGDASWVAPNYDLASGTVTASTTLVIGEAYGVLEVNTAGASTVTVPPNSSVAFDIGTVIEVCQLGAGQVTIVAGAGVTLRAQGGALKLTGQYASCSLRKRNTNEWVVVGSLTT